MRNSTAFVALSLAGSLLSVWPSSQAHACSPIKCAPSKFLPVSGTVPSNSIEFLWQPPRDVNSAPPTGIVHLYKLVNGQRSEIPSEVVDGPEGFKRVRPTQSVPEGSELLLDSEEPGCLNLKPEPARVTVAAVSPRPSKLGTIQAGALTATTLEIPTARGSCTADFKLAKVDLALTLDASARPFVDSMRHALVIDGEHRQQQRGADPLKLGVFGLGGKLEDVVYTLCGERSDSWTRDLTSGNHRIQWLVTLPDGSELRSDEVTVELQCPATEPGAAADASAETGAPRQDASDAEQGAEASSDSEESSASAGTEEDLEPEGRRVESSCALGAATGAGSTGTWLCVLALVLVRRRRAAQRPLVLRVVEA